MGAYDDIADAAAVLGTLFYRDPASDQAQPALSWIKSQEAGPAWAFGQPYAAKAISAAANALEDEGLQPVHEDFNRFFVGPYKLPAPPWGSVYTDPESVIFGNETLAVRQWMRDNLVKMNLPEREPEDQFGLMLLMVSWGVRNGVADEEIQRLFEEDLLPWAFRFLELFVDAAAGGEAARRSWGDDVAPSPFYQAVGQLARLTLEDWQTRYGWKSREIPLSR